jgi:hypothetical protein
VQQYREAAHLTAGVLDDEQDRPVAELQRVAQLLLDFVQILFA